ncbi:MAG: D-alanyl-D-alanine carboxypeptidase [Oscillospiraceae bacterium]|nr:D-alanyl-D-alanine carboxypeptidase [Oscillospiraceae bacterium]
MRKQLHQAIIAVILVMALLLPLPLPVSAQEVTVLPTEAVQAVPETVPVTPATTEPEATVPVLHSADPNTAIYQICDTLAQGMEARHIIVYHTATDQILYSKTVGNGKLFPASITKLFSSYVALQYLDPDAVITAGDELDLVHEGSSLAFIGKGAQLRVKTVVEGMMLPSGNDAAIILAAAAGRVIAQDENLTPADAVQAFVDEMNRQADALGFEKSHFSNPDGWHTGSHYTCLNDLARISKLALENNTIRRYMRLAKDETTFVSGHYAVWENSNLLLNPEEGYYRSDAIGMKTGYTRPAGYSLMSAFTFDEGEIVIGLFGYTSKNSRFWDAIQLVKAVKTQLRLEMQSDESVG